MKPFLLAALVLFIALALLASCMHTNLSDSASQTAAAQTNNAPMTSEPTGPSPTVDTLSPIIFSEFNDTIESMVKAESFDELEHIAGPSYQITGVEFLHGQNSTPVLRVKTRCECAENGSCCNATRTFVVTLMALRSIYRNVYFQTPDAAGEINILEVWCYDHANLTKVVSVPWEDVKKFFNGDIDGFQLWAKVTPEP